MALLTYTIDFTDASKPSFTIAPMSEDSTHTSLRLPGARKLNYGETYNENLVRLMEHFAASTPPAHPTEGQIWFHLTDKKLRFYSPAAVGQDPVYAGWVAIGRILVAATAPASAAVGDLFFNTSTSKFYGWNGSAWQAFVTESNLSSLLTDYFNKSQTDGRYLQAVYIADVDDYNELVRIINKCMTTPVFGASASASYGYNQTALQELADGNSDPHVTLTQWNLLFLAAQKIAAFHGITDVPTTMTWNPFVVTPSTPPYGSIRTVYNLFQWYYARFQDIYWNLRNQFVATNYNYSSASTSAVTVTNLNNQQRIKYGFTFGSDAALAAYFNTGSAITIIPTLAVPSSSDAGYAAWKKYVEQRINSIVIDQNGMSITGTILGAALGTKTLVTANAVHTAFNFATTGYITLADWTSYDGPAGSRLRMTITISRDGSTGRNGVWIGFLIWTEYQSGAYVTIPASPCIWTASVTLSSPSTTYLASPAIGVPSISQG